jgi:hypothetical protein
MVWAICSLAEAEGRCLSFPYGCMRGVCGVAAQVVQRSPGGTPARQQAFVEGEYPGLPPPFRR